MCLGCLCLKQCSYQEVQIKKTSDRKLELLVLGACCVNTLTGWPQDFKGPKERSGTFGYLVWTFWEMTPKFFWHQKIRQLDGVAGRADVWAALVVGMYPPPPLLWMVSTHKIPGPSKLSRPKVDNDCTSEDWDYFLNRWTTYKRHSCRFHLSFWPNRHNLTASVTQLDHFSQIGTMGSKRPSNWHNIDQIGTKIAQLAQWARAGNSGKEAGDLHSYR